MNRSDCKIIIAILSLIALCSMTPDLEAQFHHLSKTHGYILSFIKFAILASFGECLALRIIAGVYWRKGFGLLPKMIVWGFLGVFIKAAFVIFATGVPTMLASTGLNITSSDLVTGNFASRFLLALGISACMNCIFAPIFMTLHKITDCHIHDHHGSISALFSPINVRKHVTNLDWDMQWGFVFKKTIPLFWIPAHTITFLLPPEFRVLFAALLGIALGIILAFANLNSKKTKSSTSTAGNTIGNQPEPATNA